MGSFGLSKKNVEIAGGVAHNPRGAMKAALQVGGDTPWRGDR